MFIQMMGGSFELIFLGLVFAGVIEGGIRLGTSCRVKNDPRQQYARWVRFRPGDGQTVRLDPPRFSWPYVPEIVFDGPVPADGRFTLQISKTEDFSEVAVEVLDTPYNFYNFLPPLKGAQTWYWRVGYTMGTVQWSDVRRFTLAEDAVKWDRSGVKEAIDGIKGHPRILFDRENRARVLGMNERDRLSSEIGDYILSQAEKILQEDGYRNFPRTDEDRLTNYMQLGRSLVFVMFAHLLTGDERYGGYKPRLLQMAS